MANVHHELEHTREVRAGVVSTLLEEHTPINSASQLAETPASYKKLWLAPLDITHAR
jgi:hypothetical protein